MASKNDKQAISDDLLFSDDFDETKLDSIEADLERTPASKDLEVPPSQVKKTGKAKNVTGPADRASQAPQASPDQDASGTQRSPAKKEHAAASKVALLKKLFLFTATSVLVVAMTGLGVLFWSKSHHTAPPVEQQIVRHPIVVPSHRHTNGFLLFVSPIGKRKDLLRVDAELDFWSDQALEEFKTKQVLFCDVIYRFLSNQKPPDNSFQHWQKILEEDLFENLRRNYPDLRLNGVEMTSFQRL